MKPIIDLIWEPEEEDDLIIKPAGMSEHCITSSCCSTGACAPLTAIRC